MSYSILNSKLKKYNYGRKRKKLEKCEGYSLKSYKNENLESLVDTLLTFWSDRFNLELTAIYRKFLLNFRNSDLIHCLLMEISPNPVAASFGFIDKAKKTYSLYLIGHNQDFSQCSPGKLIILDCIQTAIQNQCIYFDFLRGAYSFKYSFGAEDRENQNIKISRRRLPNPLRRTAVPDHSITLPQQNHTD